MTVSSDEYQGFNRAVARALEKERQANKDKGITHDVTYIATINIPGRIVVVRNKNFSAFSNTVTDYAESFPNIPIQLFSCSVLKA